MGRADASAADGATAEARHRVSEDRVRERRELAEMLEELLAISREARRAGRRQQAEGLPRLLSCKALAAELGVNEATAGRIMRKLPKVKVGASVFVKEPDVCEFLRRETSGP